MPRKARKDLEIGFFHVMVQGIKKEKIFYNNKCKDTLIKRVPASQKKGYITQIFENKL